jgi:hypothetical protein
LFEIIIKKFFLFLVPSWSILLIILIVLTLGIFISFCFICWLINYCNSIFSPKRVANRESIINLHPISIDSYQEKVRILTKNFNLLLQQERERETRELYL